MWRVVAVGAFALFGCEFITGDLPAAGDTDGTGRPTEDGTATSTATGPVNSDPADPSVSSGQEGGTTDGSGGSGTSVPEGGSVTSGDGASSGGEEDDGTSSGAPHQYGGDCCEPGDGVACEDLDVAECVCAFDDFCCDELWDELCVDLLVDSGCGVCNGAGDCCEASVEGGCSELIVEDCVCAFDPFCCDGEWDETCVAGVLEYGCGECGLLDDPSCCVPHGTPSCESPDVAACVCAVDEYCCDVMWDAACVFNVELFECGPCDGGGADPTTGTGSGGPAGSGGPPGSDTGFATGP